MPHSLPVIVNRMHESKRPTKRPHSSSTSAPIPENGGKHYSNAKRSPEVLEALIEEIAVKLERIDHETEIGRELLAGNIDALKSLQRAVQTLASNVRSIETTMEIELKGVKSILIELLGEHNERKQASGVVEKTEDK